MFLNGSTGEGATLSSAERRTLAETWATEASQRGLTWIVHVGHASVEEARGFAAHAQELGAHAIAACAPYYAKPPTPAALAGWLAEVASAAPRTPFYFYDIPALTGVTLPTARVLTLAKEQAASVVGVKFTNPDLAELQRCRFEGGGRFEVLFGCDEALVAGWALGTRAGVGSTYNFAAGLHHAILRACEAGDWEEARRLQVRSARLVEVLAARGYMASAKALMCRLGVDVGPPRAPVPALTDGQRSELLEELEREGFLEDDVIGFGAGDAAQA